MTLIPTLKLRLAKPTHLVDIGGLAELRKIELKAGRLVVGAGATHCEVSRAPMVKKARPKASATSSARREAIQKRT